VAASVSLLAGATLLARSLLNIEGEDFGFIAKNRIVLRMEEPLAAYSHEHLNLLYRELQEGLERLPGVRSASLALYSPFTAHWEQLVVKPGEGMPSIDGSRKVLWDRVSPRYFDTIGQQLLEGREFTEADNATSRQVAIVNQSFVRRYFPSVDPLGKVFGFSSPANSKDFQIVGVVRDAKYANPEEAPQPMVFAPLAQHSDYTDASLRDNEKWSHFITGAQLWINGDPGRLDRQIRDVFRDVDPNFAIVSIQPLQQQINVNFDERRLLVRLSGFFGVLSLVLASLGLYGVTAYNVVRRTPEIGVRMAIGADRPRIALFVLQGAFVQTLLGLVMGLPLALIIGRLLKSRLYHVGAIDPVSLLLPAAALLFCAGAASLLPALRAASIQPIKALRAE
jgi:predicted permease